MALHRSLVIASTMALGLAPLFVACSTASPGQGGAPAVPDAAVEASTNAPDAAPLTLPYPPGPYGLGVGEVMPDITLQGYRLSREVTSTRDLPLASFRLSDVRSDPACTCMVVAYSVAGKNCIHAVELNSTLASIVAKDPTVCAAEIVAYNFDAIDPGHGIQRPPTTKTDLDAVVANAHLPFPTGMPTPSVDEAGFDVIPSIPDFFILRPSDMKIAAFYQGNGDIEARLRAACAAPLPAVETVATSLTAPRRMVKDPTHVYLSDAGHVVRIPVAGGTPETVATPQTAPDAIALDDTHVYWATHDGTGTFEIGRIAKTGGVPETLTSGASGYTSIALDDTSVWFTRADGVIGSIPLSGGPETTFAAESAPSSIAVDATSLYWIAAKNVVTQAKVAGTRTVLATPADLHTQTVTQSEPVELVLTATDVVVRGTFSSEVELLARIPKAGGALSFFDGPPNTALTVSPNGEAYYALADVPTNASAIAHTLVTGGGSDISTLGQHKVTTLVHDGTYAWWTDLTSTGAVLKRIKNP